MDATCRTMQREEEKRDKKTMLAVAVVPLIRLLIPSRLTNTLSMSSLPVKSSAITYRLVLTTLAASSMALTGQYNMADRERRGVINIASSADRRLGFNYRKQVNATWRSEFLCLYLVCSFHQIRSYLFMKYI